MSFSKAIRKGGGFLNGVDGTLTGVRFTTVPPGGSSAGDWLYMVPSIRVDGASEDITQHLFMGAAERYQVSEDGETLTGADDSEVTIGATSPAGKFLASLVAPSNGSGFPEERLPDLEAGEALNLASVYGTRMRFVQQVDEVGTQKRGKRKDAKTGREYDRTDTVIDMVYDLPTPAKKANGGAAKPGPASKTAAAAPKGAKAKATDTADRDMADETVLEILGENGGSLPKGKLSTKVLLRKGWASTEVRSAVHRLVGKDDYLSDAEERGIIAYDQSSKDQTVSLPA